MGIWISTGDNLVDEEADQPSSEARGVDVPLAEDAGDRLVQLQQQIISQTHGSWQTEDEKLLFGRICC
jgi:hypothetical protein